MNHLMNKKSLVVFTDKTDLTLTLGNFQAVEGWMLMILIWKLLKKAHNSSKRLFANNFGDKNLPQR